jgi:hypothetical protein
MLYAAPFVMGFLYLAWRLRESHRLNTYTPVAAGVAATIYVAIGGLILSEAWWICLLAGGIAGMATTIPSSMSLSMWAQLGNAADPPRRPRLGHRLLRDVLVLGRCT